MVFKPAYEQQFSAGMEQQFGNTVIGLGYVGSHGSHQVYELPIKPAAASPICVGVGSDNASCQSILWCHHQRHGNRHRPSPGVALRPFPQFTDVLDNYATLGGMVYSSLQAKIEHRYSHGFYVLGPTLGLRTVEMSVNEYANAAMSFQNAYNLSAEESVSPLDIAHNFTVMATYTLPFGRGKLVGSTIPTWADVIVGGWEVNGMIAVADGPPLYISQSTNGLGYGAQVQRPNRNFGVSLKLSNPTPSQRFNTAAFSAAPTYTFGNSKPYDGDLRGLGTNNVNLSLNKSFKLYRETTLQFRSEFYNALNHPMWASPGATYGSSTFGVSANKVNNRTGQLALKLIF